MSMTILLAINITLMYSAPLIFGSLGATLSEKSGVINLAIEGMMTIGAFFGVLITYKTGNPWLGFFAAGLSGGILALLLAISSVSFNANQTVAGIALNFIGPGMALFLSRIFFDGAVMTRSVPSKLPKVLDFIPNISNRPYLSILNVDVTSLLAFLLMLAMWFFLYKTKWGLRVNAVGEHPAAADTLGVNISLVRYFCVITSGIFAGFGGAAVTLAIVSNFSPDVISGQGFIAIAAVIFGKWKPHGAFFACLLFGFAQALVVLIGASSFDFPSQVLRMLPYIITIVVLITFVGKSQAPKAAGKPYEKGAR